MNRTTAAWLFGAYALGCAVDVQAASIGFDDFRAPCCFGFHAPLSDRYAALGVNFLGTGEILSTAAGFDGVPVDGPLASANYLAFNGDVGAFPPETVVFDNAINYFRWDFAGSSGEATLTVFLGGTAVGATTINATFGVWNEMAFSGPAFDKLVFSVANADPHFVVDNLTYGSLAAATLPVPLPASLWLFVSGGLGLWRVRGRRRT